MGEKIIIKKDGTKFTIDKSGVESVFVDVFEILSVDKEVMDSILKDIKKQFRRISFEGGVEYVKRDGLGEIATPGTSWIWSKTYPVKGKRKLCFCGCEGWEEPKNCSCIVKIDSEITDEEVKEFFNEIKKRFFV